MNKLKDIIAVKVIIERHFGSNALFNLGRKVISNLINVKE